MISHFDNRKYGYGIFRKAFEQKIPFTHGNFKDYFNKKDSDGNLLR